MFVRNSFFCEYPARPFCSFVFVSICGYTLKLLMTAFMPYSAHFYVSCSNICFTLKYRILFCFFPCQPSIWLMHRYSHDSFFLLSTSELESHYSALGNLPFLSAPEYKWGSSLDVGRSVGRSEWSKSTRKGRDSPTLNVFHSLRLLLFLPRGDFSFTHSPRWSGEQKDLFYHYRNCPFDVSPGEQIITDGFGGLISYPPDEEEKSINWHQRHICIYYTIFFLFRYQIIFVINL